MHSFGNNFVSTIFIFGSIIIFNYSCYCDIRYYRVNSSQHLHFCGCMLVPIRCNVASYYDMVYIIVVLYIVITTYKDIYLMWPFFHVSYEI